MKKRRRRRNRSNAKKEKLERALKAQEYLSRLLLDRSRWEHTPLLADNTAKALWKVSVRNRLRLPPNTRHLICRQCKTFLRPGVTSRVRIESKKRITTCLRCGTIRRWGPGLESKS